MGNLWFEGPEWLSSPDKWSQQPEVAGTSETARETVKPKLEKQLFAKEEEQNETTDPLLHNKLATLIVRHVHEQTLHGGVSATLCCMRENFWTPKLRSLTKKVIHNCTICRRYRKKPLTTSYTSDSLLPVFRTELSDPFAVTGVDFAGPMYYKIKQSTTAKAYVALFTCATTRAVHLKLCRDLTATEFQRALKEFVARRPCPQTMASDNGKTFLTTGRWLHWEH
ncbi:hypothetical protein AWC38_SpisGene8896 [Stylophora pistillata]|uniref:Integrase catalytic domain-containing protein n=1 Tax=Stylophora pistillata TaxID=50429 RepID=A0A2B4SAM2_STYPI|nr:hypothetical protein AWC38_SpisGene8896 [Stylophora pistillata]